MAAQNEAMAQFEQEMLSHMKKQQADRIRNYKLLNRLAKKGGILFTGSSLMEYFPICEMAASAGIQKNIYNRGIGGTTSDDFLREIDTVLIDLQPSKVFINIGTNDMTERGYGAQWMDHLMKNYDEIIHTAVDRIPHVRVYTMAYYPTNLHMPGQNAQINPMMRERTKENFAKCNERVLEIAKKYGQRYIDVNSGLTDENGEQKQEFSVDGIHMYAEAYEIIFRNVKPYILED